MNLEFRPDLHAKLERIAAQQGRDPSDLVHEAVERFLDYDEWFMREVEIGLTALRPLAPIFYRWLFGGIETLYRKLIEQGSPTAAEALKKLDIRWQCVRGDLRSIPRNGPAILVCNHPFGVLEGLILGSILADVRDDVKVLGNFMASSIAQVRERLIPVDTLGGPEADSMNVRSIRECVHWLRCGGLLVLFPAADVGSRKFPTFQPADGKWTSTPALLAHWSGAPVIPVFFYGANSWSFYAAGFIHKELRDALVGRELFRKVGNTMRISIGSPIDARKLVEQFGLQKATKILREQTYRLRYHSPAPIRTGV